MAKIRLARLLLCLIALTLGGVFFLALAPMQDAVCSCSKEQGQQPIEAKGDSEQPGGDVHKMAVLVPFRDRFEELMEFVPYMSEFLKKQNKHHRIFVLNQVDKYRFNRASLINVGYLESKGDCDHIAMHDVDLLPANQELYYQFPEDGPYHLAAPHLHPLYHYKTFVGGILLIKNEHFEQLNGMSNRYWGWGKEDDEFYVRLKKANIQISRPGNLSSGYRSFRHIHNKRRRPRDNYRYFNQKEKTSRLDRETGVATVKYEVQNEREMTIDGFPVTILNIQLECDIWTTPWCLRPEDHQWYLNKTKENNRL